MRDYIVAVDENGQPYLAHAGENGGWKNRATKYLGKFPNLYGNGKTAYAYTQQQLRAMQNYARGGLKSDLNKRKTMKNAQKEAASSLKDVEHLTGRWYKARIETPAEAAYDKKFAEATKKTYDKTKLGKAENAAKEAVSNAVTKVKSKSERMKDEFRKKSGVGAKDRLDDAAEKLTEASEQVKNTGTINKRAGGQELNAAQQKARDDYAAASRNYKEAKEDYENSAAGKLDKAVDNAKSKADKMKDEFRKKKEEVSEAAENLKEEANKTAAKATGKAEFSNYKEDDPDFDDKNYSESNRVGNTDFFMYKRDDGRTVILEEDMKWVLPKDYIPNGSYVNAALKNIPSASEKGWSSKEWQDHVTKEINKATNRYTTIDKAVDKVKNAPQDIKDKSGVTAKENVDAAKRNLRSSTNVARDLREAHGSDDQMTKIAQERVRQRESELSREENAYKETPLGKVESTAKSIKEQVKKLIPGAKVSGNKLVMPSGNEITIPEQFIKEEIIPEAFIKEQILNEEKIREKLIKEKKIK